MISKFDGTDVTAQGPEFAELRVRHGMSFAAVPVSFQMDGEWQTWWKDPRTSTWFYRDEDRNVTTVPFEEVP